MLKAYIKSTIIQMQEQEEESTEQCYFCKEADIGSCVTRSLYHKYNDSTTKLMNRIDEIISSSKQRSLGARKFEQIKHLVDDTDHVNSFLPSTKAHKQLLDLLEYYKFRKFVPIFTKSLDNLSMTEQLHVYYYDKLKLYYNQIKKKLNITVQQSSESSSSQSLITKSEISSNQSQILNQITTKLSKESIRQFQTESKAFEDLMGILKKNEDRMKKIKSLRTEDCSTKEANPFKDNIQRKSNLISYLASQTKAMAKKSKKVFFKYIEDMKSQKNIEQTSRIKVVRKPNGQPSKTNLFYESIKQRANSQSVYKLKKQGSKSNIGSTERVLFRNKALLEKSQQRKSCENIQKHTIKSLPKVQMNFNIRPSRSMSSASIGHPNQQSMHKKLVIRKQIEYNDHVQATKPNSHQISEKKKKQVKTPYKSGVEIDQNDNLASINRKKIEQLKMKSQRKNQGRK